MRFLRLLLLVASQLAVPTAQAAGPCIWGGSVVKCLPSTGVLLHNQRALRFGELTTNGSNYVGLKAPSTLSADTTWTLPSADGLAGTPLRTDGSGALSFAWPSVLQLQSTDYPYTITCSQTAETYYANGIGSNRTINLPAASGCTGKVIRIIRDTGAGVLTITPNGSETIDDFTSRALGGVYGSIELQSNGSSWNLLSLKDSGTVTFGFTGCFASTANLSIPYAVSGNVVTLYLSSLSSTAHATTPGNTCSASLPTFLTPRSGQGATAYASFAIRDNATYNPNSTSIVSYWGANSAGFFDVKKLSGTLTTNNFTANTAIGWAAFVANYPL